ncbi:erythromycin esterase family protein [Hymenobacter profundi]|uniref:Erythromycin esterase family protein n=1 Tax=Hymenobacter profundi TaxID=1982110 RepID=A0ABS6X6T5_9BACT|nr:erythromycin esterase family protein [Hymenobacter profundi]MBW3131021.1 erythromycin esterase family protein [Hymenobacter profundi]
MADRVAYVQKNALVVSNVDPTNEDYTDLAPLRDRLQQVTIIGLGEPIHFDGSAFQAKVRLIKFLHQELGFRILAFESGFYDCYKAWQQIQAGETTIEAARKSLYPFWISTETEALFTYIEQQKHTDNPLILAGIDCKFSGAYSRENLLPDLTSYLGGTHSALVQDTAKWRTFGASLARVIALSDYFTKPSVADTLVVNPILRGILAELQRTTTSSAAISPEQVFWQQFCRSSLTEIARKFSPKPGQNGQNANEQGRDWQMGDNAIFLQQALYRGEKMMVWAAASHLTYQGANIDLAFYYQNPRVGDYLKQRYGEGYYNIGFTGYRGKFGKLLFFHVLRVTTHQPNSIEYVLGQTKQPFLLLNFRQPNLPSWLQASLIARPFGYKETRMKLPMVMDGLFYTEDVFPNHWIPPVATPEQKRY